MEREENETRIEIENTLDRARAARWRVYVERELERIRQTPAYGSAWVRMAEEATRSILLTAEDHEAIAAETRGGTVRGGTVRVGPFTPSLRRKIEKVRAGRSLPTFEAALEHLARELFRREDRRRKERGTDGRGDAGRAPTV